jgi:hypothetical protein
LPARPPTGDAADAAGAVVDAVGIGAVGVLVAAVEASGGSG